MAKKKTDNTEQTEVKKAPPATRYFKAVMQADNENQMSVARWLMEDPLYECIWILHDKDVKVKNPSPELCKDDEEDEYFPDSERVKPHYHFIVRVPKKCSAQTMSGRFGNYVHFQRCTDPFDASYYLTHEVFRAKEKHKYSESEIKGDMDFMHELRSKVGKDVDLASTWDTYLQENNCVIPLAVRQIIKDGNGQLIRQLKSHAYFYERFFYHAGGEGE